MSLAPILMTKDNPYCWALMPRFLERIRAFSSEHTAGGTDECAERFEAAFGLGSNQMLALAIADVDGPPGELSGHVICGLETYLGKQVCMVYQFHKESGTSDEWRDLNRSIQVMIDNWCHNLGMKEIMAMAETESRGRLFKQFGYTAGPMLLRRRFS